MKHRDEFVEWLPLRELWPHLICVACQYNGRERMKVVSLLMEMVNLQNKEVKKEKRLELSALKPLWQLYVNITKNYGEGGREERGGRKGGRERERREGRGERERGDRRREGGREGRGGDQIILFSFSEFRFKSQQNLSPDILRMLTELFLCVENLSEEWGSSQDLMLGTLTKEGLNKWLEKGISNVAYVSLALGIENLASKTFIQEKVCRIWGGGERERERNRKR